MIDFLKKTTEEKRLNSEVIRKNRDYVEFKIIKDICQHRIFRKQVILWHYSLNQYSKSRVIGHPQRNESSTIRLDAFS